MKVDLKIYIARHLSSNTVNYVIDSGCIEQRRCKNHWRQCQKTHVIVGYLVTNWGSLLVLESVHLFAFGYCNATKDLCTHMAFDWYVIIKP